MWGWIKTAFSFASPVAALREQINLLKAQLAEANSLIERQTVQITKLQTENENLKQQNEDLKRRAQITSAKPIQYPPHGGV